MNIVCKISTSSQELRQRFILEMLSFQKQELASYDKAS